MKGRQRYRCVSCGVVMEGRARTDGSIVAYDRAGWDGSPERPMKCIASCEIFITPETTL